MRTGSFPLRPVVVLPKRVIFQVLTKKSGKREADSEKIPYFCVQSQPNYQVETLIEYVSRYTFNINVYDQFLVIDGRRIDFLKYRPDFHYNLSIENGGGGVIVTCELRFTFMERDFYAVFIETFTAF